MTLYIALFFSIYVVNQIHNIIYARFIGKHIRKDSASQFSLGLFKVFSPFYGYKRELEHITAEGRKTYWLLKISGIVLFFVNIATLVLLIYIAIALNEGVDVGKIFE